MDGKGLVQVIGARILDERLLTSFVQFIVVTRKRRVKLLCSRIVEEEERGHRGGEYATIDLCLLSGSVCVSWIPLQAILP